MWKRLLAAILVAAITLLITRWWRHYPWPLAALSGASLGALTFASLQTFVRLRATLAQYGPRPREMEAEEPGPASADTPGSEPDRDQQE